MIEKVFYKTRADGVGLYRTYSSEGLKLCKIGTDEIYDEAIDVEDAPFVYEETEYAIGRTEVSQEERIAELEEALDMIFSGVTE